MKNILAITLAAGFCLVPAVQATVYVNDNFNAFSSGNLVGQASWNQIGASVTSPLQVSGGEVVIPFGQTVDNQDAAKSFGVTIAPPGVGTLSFFYGFQMTMAAAPASNPSYFAALGDGVTFYNLRLTARADGLGGFQLGARVNGQSGYPFAYGGSLAYNTPYNVIVEGDMVAGNANDVVKIFVNPTSGNLGLEIPYATGTWNGIGTVTDPAGFANLVISQFGSATVFNAGLSIRTAVAGDSFSEVVSAVPEPSIGALVGLGWLTLLGLRRRI